MRSLDWFIAAGQVDGVTGLLHAGRGAVSSKLGVGHYLLVLDQSLDDTEGVAMVTVHDTGPGVIALHEVDDFNREVHTFTGGAPTDHDFDFLFVRFAP